MKVVVTGAAGFLGARVADFLLSPESPVQVTELVLVDARLPEPRPDRRVQTAALDLTTPGVADRLIDSTCGLVFHLAAVVSGQAEADFDLGMRVNLDATRALLEAARQRTPTVRFVFTSTVGVFGGDLPAVVDDMTIVTPQTSYGVAKAAAEFLVNEYSRRGFVDARIVRLPTVSVRAGCANEAVTSFASGIVREPLAGVQAVCPVPPEQELWVSSPQAVVRNIVHAATLPAAALGSWRAVNLPGLRVSVRGMMEALRAAAGDHTAALVRFEHDERIARMVASFPTTFDNTRALWLGFQVDSDFFDIIQDYIRYDLQK